jgi:Flp pilus assembly protein TadD
VELDPQRADGWSDLGVVLIRQGELAAGIEALTRAVGLRPESAEARRNLGVALDRQGKERQAARHYRAFVALTPEGRPERREVERRLAEIHAGKGSE